MEWANSDGQGLYDQIVALQSAQPYMIGVDRHGDWGETYFRRFVDPEDERKVFDLLARHLGSFLDNLRAGLNYTAYQAALHIIQENPAVKLNPNAVEFPIFRLPKDFHGKHWIKQLPQEHRDTFEAVQPYDGRYEGLWILHELARKFRHRLIHPMAMYPFIEHGGIEVAGEVVEIEMVHTDGPLKDGDVIFRFPLSDPNADVNPLVPIAVGIDDPTCTGRHCTQITNLIVRDSGTAMNAIADGIFG